MTLCGGHADGVKKYVQASSSITAQDYSKRFTREVDGDVQLKNLIVWLHIPSKTHLVININPYYYSPDF